MNAPDVEAAPASSSRREDVSFYSEGARLAGHLYVPSALAPGERRPAVLLCHGFAGFKELLLPPYGRRLAAEGFVVLAFDYRGFGDSEGEAGRLVPPDQVVDIRNALTYLQSRPEVDGARLALWGSSFGGANAVYAAAVDRRVKAVAAQLTFASGRRMILGGLGEPEKARLLETLAAVRERAVVKNKVLRLSPDQILTDAESKEFYATQVKTFPKLGTKLPLATLGHILEWEPETVVDRLSAPLLILAAEKDGVCPPSESQILFDKARGEKSLVSLPCRHYDAYAGEPFEKGIAAILGWFRRHL